MEFYRIYLVHSGEIAKLEDHFQYFWVDMNLI